MKKANARKKVSQQLHKKLSKKKKLQLKRRKEWEERNSSVSSGRRIYY